MSQAFIGNDLRHCPQPHCRAARALNEVSAAPEPTATRPLKKTEKLLAQFPVKPKETTAMPAESAAGQRAGLAAEDAAHKLAAATAATAAAAFTALYQADLDASRIAAEKADDAATCSILPLNHPDHAALVRHAYNYAFANETRRLYTAAHAAGDLTRQAADSAAAAEILAYNAYHATQNAADYP